MSCIATEHDGPPSSLDDDNSSESDGPIPRRGRVRERSRSPTRGRGRGRAKAEPAWVWKKVKDNNFTPVDVPFLGNEGLRVRMGDDINPVNFFFNYTSPLT